MAEPPVILPVPETLAGWQALLERAASEPVGVPVTPGAVLVVDQRAGVGQTLEWMGTDGRFQELLQRASAEPGVMTVADWEQRLGGGREGGRPV